MAGKHDTPIGGDLLEDKQRPFIESKQRETYSSGIPQVYRLLISVGIHNPMFLKNFIISLSCSPRTQEQFT